MMKWCWECWRDHSLTIVATGLGLVCFSVSIWLTEGEGTAFDVWCELGGTFLGIGGLGLLSWKFRERVKPEDTPK